MEQSLNERFEKLEAKVKEQDAQINGLKEALAQSLVAHAVSLNDSRVLAALRDYRDDDFMKARNGGTDWVGADFFAARGIVFADILTSAAGTDLYFKYWQRSPIEWLDERRQRRLERMSARVRAFAGQGDNEGAA